MKKMCFSLSSAWGLLMARCQTIRRNSDGEVWLGASLHEGFGLAMIFILMIKSGYDFVHVQNHILIWPLISM